MNFNEYYTYNPNCNIIYATRTTPERFTIYIIRKIDNIKPKYELLR